MSELEKIADRLLRWKEDTPRTNLAVMHMHNPWEHSRQLERELAAAKAEVDKWKTAFDAKSTVLRAWHSQFGTSQLSHAIAERDAAKAEQSESTARIAGLQARVDQYQVELAELRAENAELRKRPTISETELWLKGFNRASFAASMILHPKDGLEAFIEQRREDG